MTNSKDVCDEMKKYVDHYLDVELRNLNSNGKNVVAINLHHVELFKIMKVEFKDELH